jgi:hypothetical protein
MEFDGQAERTAKMDQYTICLYLTRKGLSAQEIHNELVQILGYDAITYSAVIFYFSASRWRAQNEEQHSDPAPDVIDDSILQALNQTPFASMRELVKSTCNGLATSDKILGVCCQALTLSSLSV